MSRTFRLVSGLVALGLLVAGCGDDESDAAETGTTVEPTTTSTTAPTTTTTLPSAGVSAAFASPVDAASATAAGETMVRRLEKFGYPGSTAAANADGSGLDITVVGVASPDEAAAIVEQLNFRGVVLYRPIEGGPFPPAAGEIPSTETPAALGVPADTDLTTVTGYDTPTTPPDQVTAESGAVIADVDFGTTNVVMRWQVGPAQLDGSTTENTQVTTSGGRDAVKVVMADSAEGLGAFNTLTQACFDLAPTCAVGAYAIQFDGAIAVASVPRPDATTFTPFTQDDLIVSSDFWTEEDAILLAIALEAGTLPVDLVIA